MNTTSKILIAVVVLQAAAIIWLMMETSNNKDEIALLAQQKEVIVDEKIGVEKELTRMLEEYESLKTTNAAVNEKLSAEQARIEELLKELKNTKQGNRAKIKELQEEADTLRKILRSYIRQVDSLNTANKTLIAENKDVVKKYENVVGERDEVSNQRDSLTNTVKKAAVLRTYNVEITPLNKRDKSTKRAKKLKKLKICFMLAANAVAVHGNRYAHIRIADPSGKIIMNDESGMFDFNGKEIAFSSRRKINYKGRDLNTCVYLLMPDEDMPKGKYSINIFVDGKDIGQNSFTMK